ncbi:MAG: glycosyltransferase family 4 protein [Gammaproteobacteria bacterium]|nr:glycosyltransferase family 4 protein [Gammaproteobacteria bacterium]
MPKKIHKVAILACYFNNFGGCEYYNFLLAKGLSEKGIEVKVYIGERPRKPFWLKKLTDLHIPYFFPKEYHASLEDNRIEINFIKNRVEEINAWAPDIIHVHPLGKLACAWLDHPQSNKNIPVVLTEYTVPQQNSSHWFVSNYADYLNKISGIVATCQEVVKGVSEHWQFQGKITLIRHLIETPSPILSPFKVYRRDFAYIGRLSVEKGVAALIMVWYHLVLLDQDCRLHIYGDGEEEGALRQLVKCLGLQRQVVFEGTFSALSGLDTIADKYTFFIQPSFFESIPTSIIELMLRGKIVIAYNVGGIYEIVNQKTGYLCPALSIESLAKKIWNISRESEDKLARISESAKSKTRRGYQFDKNLKRILNFYQKII